MQKILGIAAAMLALLLLLALIWNGKNEKTEQEQLEIHRKTYEKTESQIRSLQNEIQQADKEIRDMKPQGFVCLAFRESDPYLKDTIVPLLEEYGWKGTLILPFDYEESSEGLTKEEIHQLTEKGWEIAVAGNAEEILQEENTLEKCQGSFEEEGFGKIQGYFFDKGDYDSSNEIYQKLEAMGCFYGCPVGQKEEVSSRYSPQYPSIMECQNLSLDKKPEEVQELLDQTQEKGVPVIFSDYTSSGTWESWDMETPDYKEIFSVIHEKIKEKKLLLGRLQDYTEYRDSWEKEKEEKQQNFQLFAREQEEKIKELKEEYQKALEKQ